MARVVELFMNYVACSGRKYYVEEFDYEYVVYLRRGENEALPVFTLPSYYDKVLMKNVIENWDADTYYQIDWNKANGDIEYTFFHNEDYRKETYNG